MKLQLIAAALAAMFLVGCTKCTQQPTTETPPVATEVVPAAPTEPTTAEGAMPGSDQINEELPPEPAGQ